MSLYIKSAEAAARQADSEFRIHNMVVTESDVTYATNNVSDAVDVSGRDDALAWQMMHCQ
jgi:hypothetical protein